MRTQRRHHLVLYPPTILPLTVASGERALKPIKISPKGAPSKKRMKPFHETLRESKGCKREPGAAGAAANVAISTTTFANVLNEIN
jgi:hypothetical protein